jgi:hypothetical protein
MSWLPNSQRPPPITTTTMVATTIGTKTPETHWRKLVPNPAVVDASWLSWTMPVISAPKKKAMTGSGNSR